MSLIVVRWKVDGGVGVEMVRRERPDVDMMRNSERGKGRKEMVGKMCCVGSTRFGFVIRNMTVGLFCFRPPNL